MMQIVADRFFYEIILYQRCEGQGWVDWTNIMRLVSPCLLTLQVGGDQCFAQYCGIKILAFSGLRRVILAFFDQKIPRHVIYFVGHPFFLHANTNDVWGFLLFVFQFCVGAVGWRSVADNYLLVLLFDLLKSLDINDVLPHVRL